MMKKFIFVMMVSGLIGGCLTILGCGTNTNNTKDINDTNVKSVSDEQIEEETLSDDSPLADGTKEAEDYSTLLALEEEKPATTEEGIQITLSELLDRCLKYEEHMQKYPEGSTYRDAYYNYKTLITAAVTGGYHEEPETMNYYVNVDGEHLDGHAIDEYTNFSTVNPNTLTAEILTDYMKLIEENKKELNEQVTGFYTKFPDYLNGKLAEKGFHEMSENAIE